MNNKLISTLNLFLLLLIFQELQFLLQVQSKSTKSKFRRAIFILVSLRELHGVLFDANERVDTHSDLDRSLSNRHESQLEAKVLAQSPLQSSDHWHHRDHVCAHQLARHRSQRPTRSTQERARRMLHNAVSRLLAKVLALARVHISALANDRL